MISLKLSVFVFLLYYSNAVLVALLCVNVILFITYVFWFVWESECMQVCLCGYICLFVLCLGSRYDFLYCPDAQWQGDLAKTLLATVWLSALHNYC